MQKLMIIIFLGKIGIEREVRLGSKMPTFFLATKKEGQICIIPLFINELV